jgi:hypothetical protein
VSEVSEVKSPVDEGDEDEGGRGRTVADEVATPT